MNEQINTKKEMNNINKMEYKQKKMEKVLFSSEKLLTIIYSNIK